MQKTIKPEKLDLILQTSLCHFMAIEKFYSFDLFSLFVKCVVISIE